LNSRSLFLLYTYDFGKEKSHGKVALYKRTLDP
jgi:hypothetical protein